MDGSFNMEVFIGQVCGDAFIGPKFGPMSREYFKPYMFPSWLCAIYMFGVPQHWPI